MEIGHYFRQIDFLSPEPKLLTVGEQSDITQKKRYKTKFGACTSLCFFIALLGVALMYMENVANLDNANKSHDPYTLPYEIPTRSLADYSFFPVIKMR